MNFKLKTTSVAGLLLAGSFAFSTPALSAPCPGSQPLSTFVLAGFCNDGDKLYSLLSTNLPNQATDTLQVETIVIGPVTVHNFSIDMSPALSSAAIYTFNYTIEITDPTRFFGAMSLDGDVPSFAPDVKITKDIDLDANTGNGFFTTLTSLAGNPSGILALPGGLQKLWIYETIRIDQNDVPGQPGILNGTTNTFTQNTTNIPEPATLALFGLALAGLGFARRRKQS